jgi:beta-glucosidase-like glycosyl hydrolase
MEPLSHWIRPFADAVKAGTGAIMCSYNQINNSYGCQNSYTLNYLLKNELNFQGFVMSDWQAQHSGVGDILAGLDMVSIFILPTKWKLIFARLCLGIQPS